MKKNTINILFTLLLIGCSGSDNLNGNSQLGTPNTPNNELQHENSESKYTKTLYVDNAIGDDHNDGSSTQPFKTIQAAIDITKPGNRVLVKRGIYYEKVVIKHSGTKAQPIVIEGEKDKQGKRVVTLFGGERVHATWTKADKISPYVYKTTDIPYQSFAMTIKRDGEIKDIPKLYAQNNQAFKVNNEDVGRIYSYKDVLAYAPNRKESGPFTRLEVNYWDGIEALYAYEPKTHTTYIRFRNGENPNGMELYSAPGSVVFSGRTFNPSHQGAAVTIANKSFIGIKGFNIDGAQNGVVIYGESAHNNIIEDNEMTNGQRRVLLAQNTANNTIRDNKMHMRLLSKKYRPGAWLSQSRTEIANHFTTQEKESIAVMEHYYNVYKHEVGAVTASPQDDMGVNFIYAGDGNRIYKNEIYDTLGGVTGLLEKGKRVYIYNNLFHHISSVTTHIPESDLGEYFINDNKMYNVQIGIRLQLRIDYAHRALLAKNVHFENNSIYNPPYLGVNFYVYRTDNDHDYENEKEYHPRLEFKNNKLSGGRVVLALKTNLGSKTDLIGNIFSGVKIEIGENQVLGSTTNNWINTIGISKYKFNNSNTISDKAKWNLPKIPESMPNL